MKRFRKDLYTIEKIVWVRHQMQYIKDKSYICTIIAERWKSAKNKTINQDSLYIKSN